MLKCNLAVLLAERKLKISKVSKDTGISRTTLTALSSNQSQGIQFDTLNNLCSYLRITPSDFFCYAPFEFTVKLEEYRDNAFYIHINFDSLDSVYLFADLYPQFEKDDSKVVKFVEIYLDLPDDEDNTRTLNRYFKELSPIFKRDIEQKICEVVYDFYSEEGYEEGDCVLNLANELKGLL